MKCVTNAILAFLWAATIAAALTYEPPASASVELIHVEKVHVVEPWESAEEIAKQYLPFNKEFKTVKAFAVAIRRANNFKNFSPGTQIIVPLAYEKK